MLDQDRDRNHKDEECALSGEAVFLEPTAPAETDRSTGYLLDEHTDPAQAEAQTEQEESDAAWYCVQTKPKSEHIAAASLRQFGDVEVYCPRIRYHKSTKRGKVWFTEALFPGYLFARFVAEERLRAVSHANAVSRLLRFGEEYATLPAAMIQQIKAEMAGEDIHTVQEVEPVVVGEETEVASGPLQGFQGIVTNLLSGGERVRILLEMFGDLQEVEVRTEDLVSNRNPRGSLANT